MKKSLLVLAAAATLGACAHPLNGPEQATTIAEQHPITVDKQVMTMSVVVDRSLADLSAIDKARLRAFADTYFTRGSGPITITAPTGGDADFYGQQVAADLRNGLYELGLDYATMQGATYSVQPGNPEPEVLLSFETYVASASPCGAWDEEYYRRSHNLRTKNFGCAQQNNLAAMIADPRDLVAPQTLGSPNAQRNSVIFGLYEQGDATSSATDDKAQVQASDQ